MSDETRDFLTALFEWKAPEHYILIWTLADKRSAWFNEISQAVSYVEGKKGEDIYVGVGLAAEDRGPHRRCAEGEIAAVVGIVLDVDYQSDVHQKPNLPPQAQAADLLLGMPEPPTVVVHTGHGYHGWWLFKEPWEFDDDQERAAYKQVAMDWTKHARYLAQARGGWTVDSTFDLARVMRIPGTVNCKGGESVEVHVVSEGGWRAGGLGDFLELLVLTPQPPPTETKLVSIKIGKLRRDPRAAPPPDKFTAMIANDLKFRQSYRRNRRDLADKSPSGYDMSLATLAAMALWEPQEICDLLVASRRDAGCDLKFDHPNYYERTVETALSWTDSEQAREELKILDADDGHDALDKVSQALGVRISRVVRYWADPPVFSIEIEDGMILLERGVLTNQRKLRQVIEERCLKRPNLMKPEDWTCIARLLLGATETFSLGDENTDVGAATSWLNEYLRILSPIEGVDDSVHLRQPFRENGRVCIYLGDFVRWVEMHFRARRSSKSMGAALRFVGAVPETINCNADGRMTTRAIWRLPKGFAETG